MTIEKVSSLLIFHIVSIILFSGSSGICLYVLIGNTGFFLVSITVIELYFFDVYFGLVVNVSIDASGNWAAIPDSTTLLYSGYIEIIKFNSHFSKWRICVTLGFLNNHLIHVSTKDDCHNLCNASYTCPIRESFSFISLATSFDCSREILSSPRGNVIRIYIILCALNTS